MPQGQHANPASKGCIQYDTQGIYFDMNTASEVFLNFNYSVIFSTYAPKHTIIEQLRKRNATRTLPIPIKYLPVQVPFK